MASAIHYDAAPARRVLRSQDPDATRAYLQAVDFHLNLAVREASAFDFASTAVYLPNSWIGLVGYGSAATVRVPPDRRRDDYFIHFPVDGSAEITNSQGTVVCNAERGVISSPAGHLIHSQRDSVRATLSLTRAPLMQRLAALLGDWPAKPLEFAPTIDLDSAAARRLQRYQQLAWVDLNDTAGPPGPLALSLHEELITTALLLGQPHTYSDALESLARPVLPRDVARAIDYMHAHLEAPIALADLVKASGVPGRTLLEHFKDHWGVSPMRYLRNARLARVREALLVAQPCESVTAIAMSWGFYNAGRFALEYRKRFGENPSDTRRRSRGAGQLKAK